MTKESTEPQFITYAEFKLVADDLISQLKELNKNFNEIRSIVTLIYKDRELLKDIYEQGGAVRAALIAYDKHNEELSKETTQQTVKTQDVVANKVEEVKSVVEDKTDEVKHHLNLKKIIKIDKKKRFWLF